MSFLGKLFSAGGNTAKRAPTPAEAIQRLREVEEMLIKKQEYLEAKVGQELLIAKKNGTKNKRAALQALKRKKKYEKQLGQIDGTLTTIEYQREALENSSTNTEVFKTIEYSNKALEGAHGKLDADKVHDIMDDMQEQHSLAQELLDAISRPVGLDTGIDEDELLQELEDLEQEEVVSGLLDIPSTENLPDLPTPRTTKTKVQDDLDKDDLKELAEWAS